MRLVALRTLHEISRRQPFSALLELSVIHFLDHFRFYTLKNIIIFVLVFIAA